MGLALFLWIVGGSGIAAAVLDYRMNHMVHVGRRSDRTGLERTGHIVAPTPEAVIKQAGA